MPSLADDTEKSLLVGLGVTAATGKTSLGDGAGAIEASLLNQEALQQAGAIIAMVTNQVAGLSPYGGRSILVLARKDSVDLSLPTVLKAQMQHITEGLLRSCPKSKKTFQKSNIVPDDPSEADAASDKSSFFGGTIRASDIFGTAMVDRTIGGLTITAEDRQLADAVLMNRTQRPATYTSQLNSWNVWQNPVEPSAATAGRAATPDEQTRNDQDERTRVEEQRKGTAAINYRVYGEPQDVDTGSRTWIAYEQLRDALTYCPDREAAKSWIEAGNTLVGQILSTEKGPSALTLASQIDQLPRPSGAGSPLILRVGVDQIGGTAISRSGLLYSLGFPNAATVGSGLVANFRLINPQNGQLVRLGLIRCATRQTNLRRLPDVLGHRAYRRSITQPRPLGDTVCDFKVA